MTKSNGRDQILQAALVTFAHKGFDGASIRDIAQRADLSLSALYYYFSSKKEALFALVDKAYSTYNERTAEILAQAPDDVNAQVAYGVQHLVSYRCINVMYSRVILLETGRLSAPRYAEAHAMQRESSSIFEKIIARGRSQGIFHVDDPALMTRSVNAMCNAIPQWFVPGGTYTPETLAYQYVQATLRMLGSEQARNIELYFNGRVDASATRIDPVPDEPHGADGAAVDGVRLPPL